MANINQLKQYMSKKGEYDRLAARLKVVNIELENWDKIKAGTVTEMPIYRDKSENNSIVERSVTERYEKRLEVDRIEHDLAKLSEEIIQVDSALDCLEYCYKYLLESIYKNGLIGKRSREILHKKFCEEVKPISWTHMKELIYRAEKEYKEI